MLSMIVEIDVYLETWEAHNRKRYRSTSSDSRYFINYMIRVQ